MGAWRHSVQSLPGWWFQIYFFNPSIATAAPRHLPKLPAHWRLQRKIPGGCVCPSFVCRHVGRIHQLLKWDLAKDAGRKGRRKDGLPLVRGVSQPKWLGLSSSQLVSRSNMACSQSSITWKKHGHHRREHQFPHHQGFHGDSDQDISATYRDSATGPGSPQRSVKERTLAKLGQQFGSWDGMAVDLFDIWYHDFELHPYADILGSRL